MIEETFWIYGIPAIAFFLGVIVGVAYMVVRKMEAENEQMDRKLKRLMQSNCNHKNSRFSDMHPDFPWTCNRCDVNHNGKGVNQE